MFNLVQMEKTMFETNLNVVLRAFLFVIFVKPGRGIQVFPLTNFSHDPRLVYLMVSTQKSAEIDWYERKCFSVGSSIWDTRSIWVRNNGEKYIQWLKFS